MLHRRVLYILYMLKASKRMFSGSVRHCISIYVCGILSTSDHLDHNSNHCSTNLVSAFPLAPFAGSKIRHVAAIKLGGDVLLKFVSCLAGTHRERKNDAGRSNNLCQHNPCNICFTGVTALAFSLAPISSVSLSFFFAPVHSLALIFPFVTATSLATSCSIVSLLSLANFSPLSTSQSQSDLDYELPVLMLVKGQVRRS